MALCLQLVFAAVLSFVFVNAAPQEQQFYPSGSDETVRFSRLLSQNPDILRFTSISNAAPPLDSKDQLQNAILPGRGLKFGRRVLDYEEEKFDEHGEPIPKLITKPEAGNEYVYIRPMTSITGDSSLAETRSLTSINDKPMSRAIPVALLRQSYGNRVNIQPVFPDKLGLEGPMEGVNSFGELVGQRHAAMSDDLLPNAPQALQQETADVPATTLAFDDREEVTTMPTLEQEEPSSTVATSPAPRIRGRQRMVVNVVTSAPRVVFDNSTTSTQTSSTTTSPPTTVSTTVSTTTPTTTTTTTTTTPKPADEKENLVVEADSHRASVGFPDFEDSPARLQASETAAQPARVNVRPASSGKDYEYEYIYYYYDDEDPEGNRTSTTPGVAAASAVTVPVSTTAGTTTTTTTTTTPLPPFDSYEEEEEEDYLDPVAKPVVSPKATSAPLNTVQTQTQKQFLNEKLSPAASPVIEKSRAPKTFTSSVSSSSEQDDEEGYYEDESDDSQPQDAPSPRPSVVTTSSGVRLVPAVQSSAVSEEMPTLAKSHESSINTPIVLKQSGLIKAVPASALTTQGTTTTTTTTTTTAAPEETSAPPRYRQQLHRVRGGGGSRDQVPAIRSSLSYQSSTTATPAIEDPTPVAKTRPTYKESARRNPTRRPQVETSQVVPEQPEELPPRHVPVRTRFPPRNQPTAEVPSDVPVSSPAIADTPTIVATGKGPSTEANLLIDRKVAEENYVRHKSVNDLYAFTRLQQAIATRPGRKPGQPFPPHITSLLQSSQEQTTYAPSIESSSEVTTVPAILSGQSGEIVNVSPVVIVTESPAAPTTVATTTTDAVQLDRFGKPKRFPGRTRRPSAITRDRDANAGPSSTTTEASPRATSPNRFAGRRRSSTVATSPAPSTAVEGEQNSEPRTRIPSRNPNRFSSRTRASTTTETPAASDVAVTSEQTPPRRRPQSNFQGRRRQRPQEGENADEQSKTQTPAAASPSPVVAASPPDDQRRRYNFGNTARNRPAVPGAGTVAPRVRTRIGQSTTTTEAPIEPHAETSQENGEVVEQNPTLQSEQIEQVQASTTTTEAPKRGSAGVLGRLRNRSKPVTTTTTVAPEKTTPEKRQSRLNGILNRRKVGGAPAPAPAPVEAEEPQPESGDHKGVVVQVSSSVTETEVEHHEEEAAAPSSTTPASILNRLKSQRKPGSIVRKRPQGNPGEQ